MSKWLNYTDRMAVTVPEGEADGLRVERFEVKDPDTWTKEDEKRADLVSPMAYYRLMRDGREPRFGWYTRLLDYADPEINGQPKIWMSDTTAERDDHREAVAHIQLLKAKRVLINGLGLGMVLQAALSYDHVQHVDVVESDERVIKLVGPHYTKDPRVNIIHADAYEQMGGWYNGLPIRWDVGWSDIWADLTADNIPGMDRLHMYYRRRTQWHGCWGRKICLAQRRELRAQGLI